MDKGQMKKGLLELCILSVTSKGEYYGYEIMKQVTAAFPEINESTVYAVLRRLNGDGCYDVYTGEVSGGPKRKYYRINSIGQARLNEMLSDWQETLSAMKKLGVGE